jgi:hypothetical protein
LVAKVSRPRPPVCTSAPPPPVITSSPLPARIVSPLSVPWIASAPLLPSTSILSTT